MIRLVLVLCLLTGAAMAKPSPRANERLPAQPRDPMEEFMQSERGMDIQRLMDRMHKGEMSFDDVMAEYRGKYYGGKMPDWNEIGKEPAPEYLPKVKDR